MRLPWFVLLLPLLAGMAAPGPAGSPRVDFHGDALPDGALVRLGTLRLQPGARVWALCYSPDGKLLATGGEDHKVRVWETATGKELHILDAGVVAFLPVKGKRLLAAGSNDTIVRLWDGNSGRLIAKLPHRALVRALAASPDGKWLAVGADHEIVLWSVHDGKKLRTWPAHAGGVLSLAFLPDGKGLLSGGRCQEDLFGGGFLKREPRKADNYAMALWDPRTGRMRKQFKEHDVTARVLGCTSDGRWASLGWGKEGSTFHLWDVNARPLRTISLDAICTGIEGAAISPDGKMLALSSSREIHRWDVASGNRLPSLKDGPEYMPLALAFSPDGRTLASSAVLSRILLWDLARGKPRHVFPAHERGLWTVAVAPDGRTAVTGGKDGTVREWDLASGKPLRLLRHTGIHDPLIACARYSRDGKTLAFSYFDGVSLWDVSRGKMLRTIPPPRGKGRVVSLDFSPDGDRLVWQAIDDDDLHLWDVRASKEIRCLRQGQGRSYDLVFAPTGESIASVSDHLSLWDAETGNEIYRKPLSGDCLTCSPDGLLLAVYSDPIGIVEAATGAEVAEVPCRANHGGIWSLAFSPDGRRLAITEKENIGVWDVLGGKFAHTFGSHRCWTTSLAFTPDSKRLVSASEDTTALVWDMNAIKAERGRTPPWASVWEELKNPNRLRAYAAFCALRESPEKAVVLLKECLRPIPAVDREQVEKQLKDLDAETFAVREKATQELGRQADVVTKRLQEYARRPASLEAGRRIKQILPRPGGSLETRRLMWSLRLLEMIRTAAARDLVSRMTQGEPDAQVTIQVRKALARLRKDGPGRTADEGGGDVKDKK